MMKDFKILIAHDGISRIIEGSFQIGASREMLEILLGVIEETLEKRSFSYGWIDVTPTASMGSEQEPIDWDKPSPKVTR